jgi:aryl-alcohol dehydrogenase-like predicted oxidoreductase
MGKPARKLSEHLPPLIFGTATFNYQFNKDPYALNPNTLVARALAHGVNAFDTSPYYGPAEQILGAALATDIVQQHYPRDQYYILTKCGRIASDQFDYSPSWIRKSVRRSCRRLNTNYLDVVYCHDVEFVSPAEVLGAIKELRRIRDETGIVHYVGICGYPVDVLCDLAEMILRETGEPLDAVQSYANFNLQNTTLLSKGLSRLINAGVDVVPNASPLGMGLLRSKGPPVGGMGNWHPAPNELREACINASRWAENQGEKMEVVAVRFALENWLREASKVGTLADPHSSADATYSSEHKPSTKLGVGVMGVSTLSELDETIRIWRSVLDGLSDDLESSEDDAMTPSDALSDHEWSLQRRQKIRVLARGIREVIGKWVDYEWASPEPGFVNKHRPGIPVEAAMSASLEDRNPALLTPPPTDDDYLAGQSSGADNC